MSLHHIAKNLESKGRGDDSVLVHMTPREVGGLQALAKAHGGSLTRNPETGLYEAGFLNQVLPLVAAAAATYFTAGAAAPAIAGALGGMGMSAAAATTAGGILAGAGAGAAISGGTAALQGKDAGKAALMGGIGGAISGGLGAYDAAPNLLEGVGSATPPADGISSLTNAPITGDAGAGAGISGYGEANELAALTPPTGVPPTGVPTPPPTQAGIQAASQTGPARVDALNKLAESQGAGVTSSSFGTAPGVNAEQSLYQAQNLANPSSAGNIYPDLKTVTTPTTPTSYYSGLAPDAYVQKGGIQALPAVGLLEDEPNGVATTPEEQSKLKRISPNFYAQQPVRPNPYYSARYAAEGGIMRLANGGPTGPVERMSQNALGGSTNMFPQSQQERTNFATPTQMPASAEVTMNNQYAGVTMADGGIADLGSYSDGGRLLKGPGDGVSDNIPATIGGRQPARLADGEFVIPARIVSELGNGSTDAGAKRLYAMMDRVQAKRKKSIGKGKFAVNSKAAKDLPA